MKIKNKIWRSFVAGTAYPVLFFPLTLLAISSWFNYPAFEFRPIIWILPIILGLVNILFWEFYKYIPGKEYPAKLWITGIFLGVIFPTLGIANDIPHLLFKFPADQQFLVIPLGILFYGFIWRFIVGKMNELLGLNPAKL